MNKIKLGIIGYGKMGKIREQSINSSDDSIVTSIYEKNKSLIDKTDICCNSFDELLDSDIEGVIISTYVNTAAEYVLKALKKGKHVFCEKPPAMNSKELIPIYEFQKNSNLVLKYGFNHRYHYSVMDAYDLISRGEMGKLIWMRGVYGKAGSLDFKENWRSYKKYSGGGILMDQGIHMLDLCRYFAGEEFECISSYVDAMYWDIESEDNAFVLLKSDSGIISSLHSTANQWRHKFLLEMTFEKGYINLDGILSTTGSYAPETLIVGKKDSENISRSMGKPQESVSFYENDDSWDLELREFLSSIRGENTIKNGTLNDAYNIMTLIERIYTNNTKEL